MESRLAKSTRARSRPIHIGHGDIDRIFDLGAIANQIEDEHEIGDRSSVRLKSVVTRNQRIQLDFHFMRREGAADSLGAIAR